jgi:N-carbamoylputrescine amidase
MGICWDQWLLECSWLLVLLGTKLILYSTAIGSKPHNSNLNSKRHWTWVMQGHAGLNLVLVVCLNRIGREGDITLYGRSFISYQTGMLVEHFRSRDNVDGTQMDVGYLVHTFDLADIARRQVGWGVFCNCCPNLYGPVAMSDRGYGQQDGGGARVVRAPSSTTNIIALAALSCFSL